MSITAAIVSSLICLLTGFVVGYMFGRSSPIDDRIEHPFDEGHER